MRPQLFHYTFVDNHSMKYKCSGYIGLIHEREYNGV